MLYHICERRAGNGFCLSEKKVWKNTCRMIGLLTMLVSVFLLIGGLYLGPADVPALVPRLCLIAGLALLVVGVVFYRILKSE